MGETGRTAVRAHRIAFDTITARRSNEAFEFTALPPLAVYVHLPWCVRKCPYCDFNSHTAGADGIDRAAYLDALIHDLEQELPVVWGRPVDSVYLGGGTPSLFEPDEIDGLLGALRARLPLRPDCEISMEANPGTWERGRFRAYREAGINRLSIGIQSFDEDCLAAIGRIHGRDEAVAAAREAAEAGFRHWNIDLMFGLPGQGVKQAVRDIALAIDLGPDHISHYQLTLEPNTPFHHSPPPLPDDETSWAMLDACRDLLDEAAYRHYEVSAYAREGARCHHNLNYWRFGDYIGIGAGAHGKITRADRQGIARYAKRRHPRDYLRTAGTSDSLSSQRLLTPAETCFEFMLNALRLDQGFELPMFRERTGLRPSALDEGLGRARERGLIEIDGLCVRPSPLGRRYLDDLVLLFMPD